MEDKIFGKTVPEIKGIKSKAEKEIYDILRNLQNETGLSVDCVNKLTGGVSMCWYDMDIKLKLPF